VGSIGKRECEMRNGEMIKRTIRALSSLGPGAGHKMYTVGNSRVIMETSGRLARPLTRER